MTFEEVWKVTDTISSETAYSREEGELLYNLLTALADGSCILEIGCEYGRSTSIIAQVSKQKQFDIHLIDPFPQLEPYLSCTRMLFDHAVHFNLYRGKSQSVGPSVDRIHLLHIDGDHSYESLKTDCRLWMPLATFAVFHDYGRESLPDVKEAVDDYLVGRPRWQKYKTAGTLMCLMKI